MKELKIIYKSTNELIPYINNPRSNRAAIDPVASSIKNFGFKVPILIDSGNEIIAGHTRLEAAKKLGLEKVPCIIADDLSEQKIKAFRLADNKVGELAEWDLELLESEMEEINTEIGELEFNMSDFGFEIEDLVQEEVIEDDFDLEEEMEKALTPKSKTGEIYQLGNHRLMCGDSTLEEHVFALCNGNLVNLLLTDPPYNIDYTGKTEEKLKIQNDSMSGEDFKEFLVRALSNAKKQMLEGASFYIWHADSRGNEFREACNNTGLEVRQCLIWVKNNITLGRQDYQWKHEPCLYGWKEGKAHNWYSDRKQTTIMEFNKPVKNNLHPTMKPIDLIAYQIGNSTKANDIVLDLFGGGGEHSNSL